MSLINDALKKAQKLQMQGQAQPPPNSGGTPSASGGSGAPNRPADSAHSTGSTGSPQASSGLAGSSRANSGGNRAMPGQLFMLLAFGAGALIAVSVLATVYLLRQPAAPSPVSTAAPVVAQAPSAPIPPEKPEPAPVVKAPALALPLSIPPATPAEFFAPGPAPVVTKLPAPPPTTATAPVTTPAVAATPVASLFNPPSASSAPLDPSKPDPKILAYLDAMQVAGVRVSDTGNKVLMNDRVFRENEIVDHLLGLRLKKVESDMLTFVDERGVIYTKNL
jgi:hypothetical protein